MPWKVKETVSTDQEGKETKNSTIIVDTYGNPIWVHENDGKEVGVDAKHLFAKIPELIEEKKQIRAQKEEFESQYNKLREQFKDITDPEEALKALNTVKNLSDKKLLDANKVEEIRTQLQEEYNKAINKRDSEHKTAVEKIMEELNLTKKNVYNLTVSNSFKSSKILNGAEKKTVIPVEIAENYWGQFFKPEMVNGKMETVGYWPNGQPIYSDVKPGEYADFDEAIMKIIETSPFKNDILKGNGQSGGGKIVDDNHSTGVNTTKTNANLASYKHISEFKDQSEKQKYIETLGLEAYRKLIYESRKADAARAESERKAQVFDMGGIGRR